MSEPALELHGITKHFGSVTALDNASLLVKRSSIHALLGENAAGKTTLMRIAFGMIQADAGWIAVNAKRLILSSPADAIAAGIGMVHQQFSLIPAMSVAENVALGGKGRYRFENIAARIEEVGHRTGLKLDPTARVADLSNAQRQKLEIIRTFTHSAGVLILDEPTAVLTPRDTAELFGHLRSFADQGGSVVLITHRLQDALAHADEVTVLRRGHVVTSASMSEMTVPLLTASMLGDTSLPTDKVQEHETTAAPVATLRNLVLRDRQGTLQGPLNLEVHGGQILGIAALEGAADALLRALGRRLDPESGEIETPAHIGFVPENREEEGTIGDFSLTENVALREAGSRVGLMSWPQMREKAIAVIHAFEVRTSSPDTPARQLSGGNQQRLVLGRELYDKPLLLILENPTQGLDVNAATSIHRRMRAARNDGTAVVFYSSDLDEIAELADVVAVVGGGRVTFCPPNREMIGNLLLGVEPLIGAS